MAPLQGCSPPGPSTLLAGALLPDLSGQSHAVRLPEPGFSGERFFEVPVAAAGSALCSWRLTVHSWTGHQLLAIHRWMGLWVDPPWVTASSAAVSRVGWGQGQAEVGQGCLEGQQAGTPLSWNRILSSPDTPAPRSKDNRTLGTKDKRLACYWCF